MTAGAWKQQLRTWLEEGRLQDVLPELTALRGVQQPPEYHPEGDAFTHTLLAVAAVADADDERVFWAVLLHDIGKAAVTECKDGRWRAHGHDLRGADLAPAVLARFCREDLAADVCWLIRHHHYELTWQRQPGQPLTRRQEAFTRHPLFPVLTRVCRADRAGRGRGPGVTDSSG